MATPSEIWGYVAPLATEAHRLALEVHRIHGLDAAAPLSDSGTVRSAGTIEQAIGSTGDAETAERVA